ncbi:hypothetical protein MAR_015082, partial [Mya arenaria]
IQAPIIENRIYEHNDSYDEAAGTSVNVGPGSFAVKFLDSVEQLLELVLKRRKAFFEHVSSLHEERVAAASMQIKQCKKVQTQTIGLLKKMEKTKLTTEDRHDVIEQANRKSFVYEEILRREFAQCFGLDYKFKPDRLLENILDNLKSLGSVGVVARPSTLPAFLSESCEVDLSKTPLKGICYVDGKSSNDNKYCCFTGACFISGGRFILADWNNCCLKMFTSMGKLINRLDLKNHPWDVVASRDLDRVVLTVPGVPRVFIARYDAVCMELESSFDVESEVWGVTTLGNKLAISCNPWTKTPPMVKVFTFAGAPLSHFRYDRFGSPLFRFPEYLTTDSTQQTLYVSDAKSDAVVALSVANGEVLFTYTNKALVSPAGVAVDNQGHMYVCGRGSSSVHQVSKEGELIRILLGHKIVQCPRAICFEPGGSSMIVTGVGSEGEDCNTFIYTKLA